MTRSGRHLVFDVGGTQLRGAVYEGDGGALSSVARADAPSYRRHAQASWPELRTMLVSDMSALRSRLDPGGLIASAVVAFPGPVDRDRRVLAAPPLWGSLGAYPYALDRDLSEAWGGVEVRVTNDVTAAGYRYMRGEDEDFCVVTISTGIGNKVFVHGRPLLGRSGQGGEIGHFQVDPSPSGAGCDCGGRGHLASIASGRGMEARARRLAAGDEVGFRASALARRGRTPSTLTAEDLAEGYREGDRWAASIVGDAAGALGSVFAAVHLACGVDRFILIGGVSFGLGPPFCDDVRAALGARCWGGGPEGVGAVRVVLGEDDGHCALVGAGRAIHLGLLP